MKKGYVSPSLMCVDLMNVQRDIEALDKAGVDYYHVDMMDNHFVPNITLSTDFIKALKKITKTPLDIHMMIENPEQTIPNLSCCNENDIICIHYESTIHPQKALAAVREMGVKAGLAINPATPICVLEDLLPHDCKSWICRSEADSCHTEQNHKNPQNAERKRISGYTDRGRWKCKF